MEVFPQIDSFILNQIVSLITGYIPKAFKVAVIKPLLKKAILDPDVFRKLETYIKSSLPNS